jgi:hypothetical protein
VVVMSDTLDRTDTVRLHPHSHTLHRTEQSHYNQTVIHYIELTQSHYIHSHTLHRTDTVTLQPHSHALRCNVTVSVLCNV